MNFRFTKPLLFRKGLINSVEKQALFFHLHWKYWNPRRIRSAVGELLVTKKSGNYVKSKKEVKYYRALLVWKKHGIYDSIYVNNLIIFYNYADKILKNRMEKSLKKCYHFQRNLPSISSGLGMVTSSLSSAATSPRCTRKIRALERLRNIKALLSDFSTAIERNLKGGLRGTFCQNKFSYRVSLFHILRKLLSLDDDDNSWC